MGKQVSSERKGHWEGVYGARKSTEVSWYQEVPGKSLELVSSVASSPDDAILDVGGGASTLVDHLLDAGYRDVTVLDLANGAFSQSQGRLGERASIPHWLVSDVTRFEPQREYQVWHDRAALHFLTDAEDRARYVSVLKQALAPGGHAVIATFGPEGPLKCSGLEIRRYTVEMLAELLGPEFELQSHELENHQTPMGSTQQFLYSCWMKRG